jgi:DNA-binding Lrp family transcriptional regulator
MNEKKYEEFIKRHSVNGKYDPKKGLEGLLSCLTPDPKGIVLLAMAEKRWYFNCNQLYRDVQNFMKRNSLEKKFPISFNGVWAYCEFKNKKNKEHKELVDGSLVEIGAVVKQLNLDENKYAYQISDAGIELARPLVLKAIEFVHKARNSKVPHRYDSMGRILGSVNSTSPTKKRRPSGVYKFVKFLYENPGQHRITDIASELEEGLDRVSIIAANLGYCGVVDYESMMKEIEGKRPKGWSVYVLNDEKLLEKSDEEIWKEVKNINDRFDYPGHLKKVFNFIKEKSKEDKEYKYEWNELSEELKIPESKISRCLSLLSKIGLLKSEEFKGREIRSKVEANDLTKLFYETVLQPAYELATNLDSGLIKATFEPEWIEEFLENYNEERSYIGPEGGNKVRKAIIKVLREESELKLDAIAEKVSEKLGRKLRPSGCRRQIEALKGKIEKTKKGWYRLKQG